MSELIAATEAFRSKVAIAVAHGYAAPTITHVAWGSGSDLERPEDIQLQNEVARTIVSNRTPDGVTLSITAEINGEQTSGATLTEVGLIDSDGDLAGRRVFSPIQLDSGTSITTTFNLIF